MSQATLFDSIILLDSIDTHFAQWKPKRAPFFSPQTIVLAKGCDATESRRQFVNSICAVYPDAERIEMKDTPHSRIAIEGRRLIDRHRKGKQTLAIGELKSSVRFSEESGNNCPNYWHFSPYGFCPFGCHYCYLAGTTGVKFSPTVKIYLNLDETLQAIDKTANRIGEPTGFFLGKLQDGLALDPLTGYSRIMIPFFANHPCARLVLLTKSASVANLLSLEHNGRTTLSWSLNPQSIIDRFEINTPPLNDRLAAMEACAAAGYPVRATIMPLIPIEGWRDAYGALLQELLECIPLQRITLGGICSYKTARVLMNQKLTSENAINQNTVVPKNKTKDGRTRYSYETRVALYSHTVDIIRRIQPRLPIHLCMEEWDVVKAVGVGDDDGKCGCIF